MASKAVEVPGQQRSGFWLIFLLLYVVLSLLFRFSYLPGYVAFSNDGPLGALASASHKLPEEFTGGWQDLNSIGIREGTWPSITYATQWLLGPLMFSKFRPIFALLLLGLGAWYFFKQLKFSPVACVLGALAATLNSSFFSVACWGISAHTNMVGLNFFALGLLADTSSQRRWIRVALAGLAVGMGVAEAADLGAIFSLYVAAFVIYQAWNAEGSPPKRLAAGLGRLAVVAGFAVFLATQSISGLVGTAIQGISGTKQDAETKQHRWDFATQWSLPKREALSLVVPGLFGYRMDTPRDMSAFENAYEGGVYWGAVGRDPAWDRWFAGGKQGPAPGGFLRFSGGGVYAGILVVLVAIWTSLQALRKEKSVFSRAQRKYIWFWMVVLVISLLLSFGRYAPFYRLFYALPYASTIRNPAKFLHIVDWALIILFAYGINAISRRYMETASAGGLSLSAHLKSWWAKTADFERKWILGCVLAFIASLLGALIYVSSRKSLESYLQTVGFGDPAMAGEIAGFSLSSAGWFLVFLAVAIGLLVLVLSSWFAGRRAKLGGILLGILLVVDLARANQPWIIVWDYQQKYASNPVIDFLRNKPHEHRVASLPRWLPGVFNLPPQLANAEQYLQQLYTIEWAQHQLLYYNVQSLDVVQMPRMPEDLEAFETSFQPRSNADLSRLVARRWELSNTRYILGATGMLDLLNNFIDPAQHRFRIAQRFDIVPKPGITTPTKLEELTATLSTNGNFALFEFTGASPRAKLYENWQVSTNAQTTLSRLTGAEFNPAQQVLVTEQIPASAATATTNQTPGTVDFTSYSPNHIVLSAKASAPSILLLNDRYDSNWKVTVDGKPEQLLHANYIMRGVQLPPGNHTIDFRFAPPIKGFYVSLAAIFVGLGLIGVLVVWKPRDPVPEKKLPVKEKEPVAAPALKK